MLYANIAGFCSSKVLGGSCTIYSIAAHFINAFYFDIEELSDSLESQNKFANSEYIINVFKESA